MDFKGSVYNIQYHHEVRSTNSFMKELLKKNLLTEGAVILADYQTNGRGQGSNKWYGKRGLNIMMSLFFKPEIKAQHHFFLTEFISLAIIDILKSYNLAAKIKWPNDIYVENKKIAGILIENTLENDTIKFSIAGIGLNVNEALFPNELPDAVSMKMIIRHSINRKLLIEKLIRNIHSRYRLIREEELVSLHRDYNDELFGKNTLSQFSTPKLQFKASILEVKESGELILVNQEQKKMSFLFGEVKMLV